MTGGGTRVSGQFLTRRGLIFKRTTGQTLCKGCELLVFIDGLYGTDYAPTLKGGKCNGDQEEHIERKEVEKRGWEASRETGRT